MYEYLPSPNVVRLPLIKKEILQLIMELFLELLFESGSMHQHGQDRTLDEPQLIIRPE